MMKPETLLFWWNSLFSRRNICSFVVFDGKTTLWYALIPQASQVRFMSYDSWIAVGNEIEANVKCQYVDVMK